MSSERILCAKSRCACVTMWLSHIEEPYISQLGSTHRNKQPYGKQTYFLLLHFICFKIVHCHKSRILTTLHLEKCKYWSPETARQYSHKTSELQLIPNLEQALYQPSLSSECHATDSIKMCIKWENSQFWKYFLKLSLLHTVLIVCATMLISKSFLNLCIAYFANKEKELQNCVAISDLHLKYLMFRLEISN